MRKLQPHLKPARPWKRPEDRSLDFEAEMKRRKYPINERLICAVTRALANQFADIRENKTAAAASMKAAPQFDKGASCIAEIVYVTLSNYVNFVEKELVGRETQQDS